MSASLVGSEMCIRDRPSPRTGIERASAHHGVRRFSGFDSAPAQASNLPPVSYTHLTLPTICSV
eukprot:14602127-Alexandrium_andersonii.AAC.1